MMEANNHSPLTNNMKNITLIVLTALILTLISFTPGSFKDDQMRYSRVRQAYADKEQIVKELLKQNSIETENLRVYLRAFKSEEIIELWAKNQSDTAYTLIKEYDICEASGELGPKRKQNDEQVPEGYYKIDRFNHISKYYLSLGINYPNKSDRILGVKGHLGGDIFIHGGCASVGCTPITDDQIKELYIFCVEAKDNGQKDIQVTIFPAKMTDENYSNIKKIEQTGKPGLLGATKSTENYKDELWADLKSGYDYFNETKRIPMVVFLDDGRCEVGK